VIGANRSTRDGYVVCRALLGIMLDLLVSFIGEDLTLGLVRGAWPDLPSREARYSDDATEKEAASSLST
jgi:hypothetical protein